MDTARTLSDWTEFKQRRAESKKRGKLRGIGLANYIECTMGYPREWSKVTVLPDGEIEVAVGTLSSGQGHETSFAQCVSEWFGVPFEAVRLVQGDTDIVPVGGGSHSGRSMRMAGFVHGQGSGHRRSREAAPIAAHMLQVDPSTVEFSDGRFRDAGFGSRLRRVRDRARGAIAQRSRRRVARAAGGGM